MSGNKLTIGQRPEVLPHLWWQVLVVAAIVSVVVLGATIGSIAAGRPGDRVDEPNSWSTRHDGVDARERAAGDVVGAHLVLYAAALAGATLLNGALFDRYLVPIVFSVSVLLLRTPRSSPVGARPKPGTAAAGIAALVLVSITSLTLMANSAAFDGARWRAGKAATLLGYAPDTVDAGFEWVGTYGHAGSALGPAMRSSLDSWWSHAFGLRARCVVVTASPVPAAGTPLLTIRYRRYLIAGRGEVFLYRTDDGSAACTAGG